MDALWNSAELEKAIEESQEMTCRYSPPSSPHFSPLRLPYPWSPTPRNSAESDKAIEESQEMTCWYSLPSSPYFSPLRSPYPWSPTPRNSEESDKTVEESQEMTCCSMPPPPVDSSPLRSPYPWSSTNLPWSPAYLDQSPTDFSQWSTDFLQSSTHVARSPPRPLSLLPELSPLSNSVVPCRGSNQSMETPPHFQQHEVKMIFPRCRQNRKLKLEQQLLQLQRELLPSQRRELLQLVPKLLQLEQLPSQRRPYQQRQLQQLLQQLQPPLLLPLQSLRSPMLSLRHQMRQELLLQLSLLPQQRLQLPPLWLVLLQFELELLHQLQFEPPQKNNNNTLNLNPTRNIGTFNTAEEAAVACDRMVVRPSFFNKNMVEPKTAHIIEIPPWSAQQEDDQDENSVFGCKEATGNDEIEATGEDQMAKGGLNSRILGKCKRKVKTFVGERETKKSGAKITIPLDDILQVKGMSLKEAAINLDVSKSTLKRVCREHGIPRWPPRENNKLISNSLPTETLMDINRDQIPQSRSNILPPNQASASVDTNTVTVKARYEKGITINFQLSSPWRRVELEQQVEMRLPLEAGTYYIKYKDEENDLIWIACDEDLEDYISTSTSMEASLIDVFLVPK